MTARDQKQLKVFVVLIVLLGVTMYLSLFRNAEFSLFSLFGTSAPEVVVSSEGGKPKDVATAVRKDLGDARIRLDLMKAPGQREEVGQHSLFDYRESRVASQTTGSRGAQAPVLPPTPPAMVQTTVTPPVNPGPPPPPPPPPMDFKYDGFVKSPTGPAVSLSQGTNRYYNLREDDIVLGRYRIARVTDAVVEIEDLQFPRRQAFARAQQ